jgi:hypothetical protein
VANIRGFQWCHTQIQFMYLCCSLNRVMFTFYYYVILYTSTVVSNLKSWRNHVIFNLHLSYCPAYVLSLQYSFHVSIYSTIETGKTVLIATNFSFSVRFRTNTVKMFINFYQKIVSFIIGNTLQCFPMSLDGQTTLGSYSRGPRNL